MIGASEQTRNGTVISITGRVLRLFDREIFEATIATRALKPAIGDVVACREEIGRMVARQILPRRSCLTRTFGNLDKEIAANIDRLFIVTAGAALFNTKVIDRTCTVAWREEVPVTIVLNKIDLGDEPLAAVYSDQGFNLIRLAAKHGTQFEQMEIALRDPALRVVALCGISGVGKSTILNRLIPEASRETNEVSVRTGQGRQTTSQAAGYTYERPGGMAPLIIVDLPGAQAFGVSHLTKSDIVMSFPEMTGLWSGCQYSDCLHLAEPRCAVKAAVDAGRIAVSRYESYVNMVKEIEEIPESRKYRRADSGPRPLHDPPKRVKDSRE